MSTDKTLSLLDKCLRGADAPNEIILAFNDIDDLKDPVVGKVASALTTSYAREVWSLLTRKQRQSSEYQNWKNHHRSLRQTQRRSLETLIAEIQATDQFYNSLDSTEQVYVRETVSAETLISLPTHKQDLTVNLWRICDPLERGKPRPQIQITADDFNYLTELRSYLVDILRPYGLYDVSRSKRTHFLPPSLSVYAHSVTVTHVIETITQHRLLHEKTPLIGIGVISIMLHGIAENLPDDEE